MFAELIVNPEAVAPKTDSVPTVPPTPVFVRKIFELAVTLVSWTCISPPMRVADPVFMGLCAILVNKPVSTI